MSSRSRVRSRGSGIRSTPTSPRVRRESWDGINSDGKPDTKLGKTIVLRKPREDVGEKSNVQVSVRIRPMSKREEDKQSSSITNVIDSTITLTNPRDGLVASFTFDHAYDMNTQQTEIYDDTGFSVVQNALEGYNCCIIAYGQTGSGKSHTMMGTPEDEGLIPRIARALISSVEQKKAADDKWDGLFEISYLEIYAEKVYDLLGGGDPLRIRFHPKKGVYVEGLRHLAISSFEDIQKFMVKGNKARATAATQLNTQSSRSHAIFTIAFKQFLYGSDRRKLKEKRSVINLVDLAGSERVEVSGVTGVQFQEAIHINKSLVTLGLVITKLVRNQTLRPEQQEHIPVRDSALTWILSDSIGGNSKTLMIATVSPADVNFNESLNTLRYAYNAKRIVNTVSVNEDSDNDLILALQREIEELRATGNAEEIAERQRLLDEAQKSWDARLRESRVLNEDLQQDLEHEKSTVQQLEAERQSLAQQLNAVLMQRDKDMAAIKDQTRREVEDMVVKQIGELKRQYQERLMTAEEGLASLRKRYSQLETECTQKSRLLDESGSKNTELQVQLTTISEQRALAERKHSESNDEIYKLRELLTVTSTNHAEEINRLGMKYLADSRQIEEAAQTRLDALIASYEEEKSRATEASQTICDTLAANHEAEKQQLAEATRLQIIELEQTSIANIRKLEEQSTKMAMMDELQKAESMEKAHVKVQMVQMQEKHVAEVVALQHSHAEAIEGIRLELLSKLHESETVRDELEESVRIITAQLKDAQTLISASAEKHDAIVAELTLKLAKLEALSEKKETAPPNDNSEPLVPKKLYDALEQRANELQESMNATMEETKSMRSFIDKLRAQYSGVFDELRGNLSDKDRELIGTREQLQSLTRAKAKQLREMLKVASALKQIEKEVIGT